MTLVPDLCPLLFVPDSLLLTSDFFVFASNLQRGEASRPV
jgi:hypothetical protein